MRIVAPIHFYKFLRSTIFFEGVQQNFWGGVQIFFGWGSTIILNSEMLLIQNVET